MVNREEREALLKFAIPNLAVAENIRDNIAEAAAWVCYFDGSERNSLNWELTKKSLIRALQVIETDVKKLI